MSVKFWPLQLWGPVKGLTFHPEVGGASDALGRDEIAGALAGVVGVVDDPVQLAAGPLVEVEVEGRGDRLEVVLGEVRRLLTLADGVTVVVVADVGTVLQPDDVAERRTLDLALQGEVANLRHGAGVRRQPDNEAWRSWKED